MTRVVSHDIRHQAKTNFLRIPKMTSNTVSPIPEAAIIVLLLVVTVDASETTVLQGVGATFPARLYKAWSDPFRDARLSSTGGRHRTELRYRPVGSSAGVAMLRQYDASYAFAASDRPLEAQQDEMISVPIIFGAIAIVHSLPGKPKLCLERRELVEIFSGRVRRWSDLAVNAEGCADLSAMDKEIHVVVRHDRSGTSEMFAEALSVISDGAFEMWDETSPLKANSVDDVSATATSSPATTTSSLDSTSEATPLHNSSNSTITPSTIPSNTSLSSSNTSHFLRRSGNLGVIGAVKVVQYAIAYVSLADAIEFSLARASLRNRFGALVSPSWHGVDAAIHSPRTSVDALATRSVADLDGERCYPLVGVSYVVVRCEHKLPSVAHIDCRRVVELLAWIRWAVESVKAREIANRLGFGVVTGQQLRKVRPHVPNVVVYVHHGGRGAA